MKIMNWIWILIAFAIALLSGCSSDSDSLATGGNDGVNYGGIAVDPYIEGAVFQEVAADGVTVLQRESTPSDEQGRFAFPEPLTAGSVVELKISRKGMHLGTPFEGMLRRQVGSEMNGDLVVSPLTTLLAAGIEEEDAVAILSYAGVRINVDDLYLDPMRDLDSAGAMLDDQMLRPLHANMALSQFMTTIDDFQIDRNDLLEGDNFLLFATLIETNENLLNTAEVSRLSDELGESIHASAPLLPVDLLPAVVKTMRSVVEKARQQYANGTLDPKTISSDVETARQHLRQEVLTSYVERIGEEPPPSEIDGADVFAAECASCHNLGSGGMMDLAGKGDAVVEVVAGQHQGRVLDAAELQALVAHVDSMVAPPTPDPEPLPDGKALYDAQCAACHKLSEYDQTGSAPELAGTEQMIPGKINAGHRGVILTTAEIEAVVDWVVLNPVVPNPDPTPDPSPVPDGVALYESECQGCHGPLNNNNISDRSAAGIQQAIDDNLGSMGMLSLTADEVQAISDSLPAPAPTPDPDPVPADGQALYDSFCAGCHTLGDYDVEGTAPELGGAGNQVPSKLQAGHMGISMTADEVSALASWANANPAPAPDPDPTPVDGQAIYDAECAGCHALGDYDTSGSPDIGGLGNQVISKIEAGHMGKVLTPDELNALADWADANPASVTPPDPPPTPVDGQALYDNYCSGCHSVNEYDTTGAPDLASTGNLVVPKLAAGHNGMVLTVEEELALADFLDQYPAAPTGPDYSDCTACHAQPPNGDTFPNAAGSHAVHAALSGIGNDCSACHSGATHDDLLEVEFSTDYDAKNSMATSNTDGTCSSVSCHGGAMTPNWYSGSLSVNTQCASCHSSGTAQYNGYYSGEHSEHRRYDCTVCHNTSKLANGHFTDLSTSGFEQSPAATIGGDSTRVGSYSGGSCSSVECHGSENW